MTAQPLPTRKIQIIDAFSYGWRKLMRNPAPWLIMAVAAVAVGSVMGWLSRSTAGSPGGFLFGLAAFVVTNLVWFVMVRMSLAAARGEAAAIPDMSGRWDLFVTYLVAGFLYGIGVAIGLVLLIVPGIMFAVAYWFFGFIVVDTGSDPITGLKEARVLSKGKRWPLFGAGLLAILVHILGVMAFGVGILLAIPVTYLAAGPVYMQLQGEPIAE
jgi:hypothetical protein